MKEDQNTVLHREQPEPNFVLSWPEIAAAVFASKGFTSGWYRIGLRLQFAGVTARFAFANTEPGTEPQSMPAGIVGVDALAIYEVQEGGDMIFDAGAMGAPVPKGAVLKKTAPKKRAGSSAPRRLNLKNNTFSKSGSIEASSDGKTKR